jgi:deoxyribodipyrimidine photo-lyase
MAVQLVWYKKDLRLADHLPLSVAAKQGPMLCVYAIEPEIIQTAEFDSSHQVFINQCLEDLHSKLLRLNSGLVILRGSLPKPSRN